MTFARLHRGRRIAGAPQRPLPGCCAWLLVASVDRIAATGAMTLMGSLQAWDPVRQRVAWEVPLPRGLFSAGTLTTAGNLVFHGRVDGTFRAYAADSGKELWQYDLRLGISAPPITYGVNGKQYIAVLVGFGGGWAGLAGPLAAELGWAYGVHRRYLVAFALDGKGMLPAEPPPTVATPLEANFAVDEPLARNGRCAVRALLELPRARRSGLRHGARSPSLLRGDLGRVVRPHRPRRHPRRPRDAGLC